MNTDAPSSHPAGPAMIALNPQGVVAMKRDMDLVAKIMEAVEAKRDLRPAPISVEGYDEWVVQRHIEAMEAAGLIDGLVCRKMSQAYPTVLVGDLTWEGHEFAATLKSPAWQEVKARLSPADMMTASFKVLADIGAEAARAYLLRKLGLGS